MAAYKRPSEDEDEVVTRVRTPRDNEVLGLIEQRVGGSRSKVRCLDGKERICRIPGRMKRRLWIREGDVVIVEPWEFGGDEKGDIIYKYRPHQVRFLRDNGFLDELDEFEQF